MANWPWHRRDGRWSPGAGDEPERLAVAVDGTTDAEHGWVCGDDSGASLGDALTALRASTVPVTAITRLTRSTFRSLDAIGATVRDADAWVLVVPEVVSDRTLSARLAMALPWALRAATRWGERAFLWGAPLCLVGPHANRVLTGDGRSYGGPCDRCGVRGQCSGATAAYLDRFGSGELRARPAGVAVGPAAESLAPSAAIRL